MRTNCLVARPALTKVYGDSVDCHAIADAACIARGTRSASAPLTRERARLPWCGEQHLQTIFTHLKGPTTGTSSEPSLVSSAVPTLKARSSCSGQCTGGHTASCTAL